MGATVSTGKKHFPPGIFGEGAEAPSTSVHPASCVCPHRVLENGISSGGGGEGWAGGAGEPPGCSARARAPLRVNGALHNLVMKELLRVEPPSLRSGASLQHGRDAAACTGRVKRRQHPVKDLVFNFASHTGTDPAKSSPD